MKFTIVSCVAVLGGMLPISATAGPLGRQERQQAIGDRIHQRLAALDLAPEQESKIIDALRDARTRIQQIRQQARGNISSVLTPQQRQQLRQLRQKAAAARNVSPAAP